MPMLSTAAICVLASPPATTAAWVTVVVARLPTADASPVSIAPCASPPAPPWPPAASARVGAGLPVGHAEVDDECDLEDVDRALALRGGGRDLVDLGGVLAAGRRRRCRRSRAAFAEGFVEPPIEPATFELVPAVAVFAPVLATAVPVVGDVRLSGRSCSSAAASWFGAGGRIVAGASVAGGCARCGIGGRPGSLGRGRRDRSRAVCRPADPTAGVLGRADSAIGIRRRSRRIVGVRRAPERRRLKKDTPLTRRRAGSCDDCERAAPDCS